jgi:hypothetical protein
MVCKVGITKEKIFIKTYKIKVLIHYFLKQEVIIDDSTYIFFNLGKWYAVPMNSREDAYRMMKKANDFCDNYEVYVYT